MSIGGLLMTGVFVMVVMYAVFRIGFLRSIVVGS